MRLAVYGTLRRDYPDKGKVEGFSLVFPGTHSFPTIIKNQEGKGAIVELFDVTEEDLYIYDEYEGVRNGLYIRTTAPVKLENGKTEKAWIYVAGPEIWQNSISFTEVPDGDWYSKKTLKLLNRVYEKDYKKT